MSESADARTSTAAGERAGAAGGCRDRDGVDRDSCVTRIERREAKRCLSPVGDQCVAEWQIWIERVDARIELYGLRQQRDNSCDVDLSVSDLGPQKRVSRVSLSSRVHVGSARPLVPVGSDRIGSGRVGSGRVGSDGARCTVAGLCLLEPNPGDTQADLPAVGPVIHFEVKIGARFVIAKDVVVQRND